MNTSAARTKSSTETREKRHRETRTVRFISVIVKRENRPAGRMKRHKLRPTKKSQWRVPRRGVRRATIRGGYYPEKSLARAKLLGGGEEGGGGGGERARPCLELREAIILRVKGLSGIHYA